MLSDILGNIENLANCWERKLFYEQILATFHENS